MPPLPRPRLAPGVEIVTVPGHPAAVRTQDGDFLRINADQEAVARLAGLLDGSPDEAPAGGPAAPAATPVPADPETERLLAGFGAAGHLGDPDVWPGDRRTVLVLGDEELTGPLADFLRAAGARPRNAEPREVAGLADPRTRPDASAVVWCLDRPVPPGLWDDADRLPARGIAWIRCHREGRQAWIEPTAAAPGDVLAAHVRARRLAATPAHRELAAHWAARPASAKPPTGGTAAGASFVAALVAYQVHAWATGRDTSAARPGALPAGRRLRRVDLRDLEVSEHPVLPVPAVAPLPAPPA